MRKRLHLAWLAMTAVTINAEAATNAAPTAEESSLIPFVMPWDDSSASVTNIASWNHRPAGKFGFVFTEDGHLYTPSASQGQPPQRIRFFGVNLCYGANFPDKNDAPIIAARMAKFGINCVRFHHMDGNAAPSGLLSKDLRSLDPGQLDRLDYFIAQLKENGIYVNLNLHVIRKYPEMPYGDGIATYYFKGLDLFMPEMIDWQITYAQELLQHVNPYTGLSYAEDPVVAFVEINNENGIFGRWYNKLMDKLDPIYTQELRSQWDRWVLENYQSREQALAAWGLPRRLSNGSDYTLAILQTDSSAVFDYPRGSDNRKMGSPLLEDWTRFLVQTERQYYSDMRTFLKEDVGVRALIIGSQPGGSYSTLLAQVDMDVIDAHGYWAHPEFLPGEQSNWSKVVVENKSLVNDPLAGPLSVLAQYRIDGKPFTVTEYNHASPNTYGAEAFILLGAYGALQDWDGIFAFAYSHGGEWDRQRIAGNFDIHQHPVKMATLPLAAALFRRGDMTTPAQPDAPVQIPEPAFLRSIAVDSVHRANAGRFGGSRQDALRAPVSAVITDSGPEATKPALPAYTGPIVSDGGQLTWDANAPHGVALINTPHTKAVVGFANERTFTLDDADTTAGAAAENQPRVVIRPGATLQDWSVIGLTALEDGEPTGDIPLLGAPGKVLLIACGYTQNTGMFWHDEEKSRLASYGTSPTLVEVIDAEIQISLVNGSTGARAWALDERGQRREELPLSMTEGTASIRIGKEWQTLWYEIEFN